MKNNNEFNEEEILENTNEAISNESSENKIRIWEKSLLEMKQVYTDLNDIKADFKNDVILQSEGCSDREELIEKMQENGVFENMLSRLNKIKDALTKINEENGTLERARQMREEIKELKWSGICQKYHPDINVDDPAKFELFKFYKYLYDTMKENNEI